MLAMLLLVTFVIGFELVCWKSFSYLSIRWLLPCYMQLILRIYSIFGPSLRLLPLFPAIAFPLPFVGRPSEITLTFQPILLL